MRDLKKEYLDLEDQINQLKDQQKEIKETIKKDLLSKCKYQSGDVIESSSIYSEEKNKVLIQITKFKDVLIKEGEDFQIIAEGLKLDDNLDYDYDSSGKYMCIINEDTMLVREKNEVY